MEIVEIRQTDGSWKGEAVVRFPRSEPAFEGHFPHAPILPGVVLIDLAVEIASRVLKRPLRLAHLANVKFCSVVEPDQEVRFSFTAEPDPSGPDRIKVVGRWSRGADKIAEMHFMAVSGGSSHDP
jgi:3-hydroxymyristoyl/3-hydroxydecanoyl-(acyl carrier protein) dehydratase